jgi:flagellar biosynthesis/type III secretory pathway protein FliH
MSYESPINIIQDTVNEIVEMHDNTVYMKIREIVDVDKKELLKALAYDRDQYNKGFNEGYDSGYNRGIEVGKMTALVRLAKDIIEKYGDNTEEDNDNDRMD